MNCDQARAHWHLFHDSEGDAEVHHQINEHLAMCPDCSRWFFQQSRLEDALSDALKHGVPTEALWANIQKEVLTAQPASSRSWSFLRNVLTVAACLFILVSAAVWFTAGRGVMARDAYDLAAYSTSIHDALSSGREAIMFASRSDVEVEKYLRRQVSFPVRCPPRGDVGFQVEGGGVCRFEQDSVAYVVGKVDEKPISVFILPRDVLSKLPDINKTLASDAQHWERRGGMDVVMASIDRNVVLVVGKNGPERLRGVLNAYGTYHDHAPASQAPGEAGRGTGSITAKGEKLLAYAGSWLSRAI